jgi:hypothetical protein
MIRRSAFLVVTACFVLGLGERAVALAQRAPRVALGSVQARSGHCIPDDADATRI